MKSPNEYTAEELQELLRMAQAREAEAAKLAPKPERSVKVGSLVNYLDGRGMEHAALVLEMRGDVLRLKVFRFRNAQDLEVEVGPGRWRR